LRPSCLYRENFHHIIYLPFKVNTAVSAFLELEYKNSSFKWTNRETLFIFSLFDIFRNAYIKKKTQQKEALHNFLLNNSDKEKINAIISIFSRKDPYTCHHQHNVAIIACSMDVSLNYNLEEM